jgi:hypothetical protein
MSKWHGGKGDKPRKTTVSQEKIDSNWDAIFGGKEKKNIEETWEHWCTVKARKLLVTKEKECPFCGISE